jgi:hypothetical protein
MSVPKTAIRSDGNSLFSSGYSFHSSPYVWHNGYNNGNASISVDSYAQAWVKVFGTKQFVFSAWADAEMDSEDGQAEHDLYAYGQLFVGGTQVLYEIDRDPDGNHVAETGAEDDINQTLFRASYSTTVGPVPVTVRGDITGWARGGTGSEVSYFFVNGSAENFLIGNCGIRGRLTAFAGIEDVLAVGVTTSILLLETTIRPTGFANVGLQPSGAGVIARYDIGHRAPLTFASLDGNVKVWADVTPFWSPSKTLISWKGIRWTQDLWNDTQSNSFDLRW